MVQSQLCAIYVLTILGDNPMASPIAQQYAATIHDQTKLFATWLPNAAIAIGDYGPVEGALFERFGNLGGLNSTPGPAKAGFDIQVGVQRGLNFDASALAKYHLAQGQALLEIGFTSASGVMLSTQDAQVTQINDIPALGKQLIELHKQNNWDLNHGVVVEVTTVSKATVLASQQSGAQAKFSVDGKTPNTGPAVANLKADASMLLSQGVGVNIVGEGPLTPLFRLAFLRTHWFKPPDIQFRGAVESAAQQVQLADQYVLEVYGSGDKE
jgi:hypothetical protein